MRPEEVYRIERENVHLAEGYIFSPFGKTKAARRRITLTATAFEVLRKRLEKAGGRCLFPHEKDANLAMLRVKQRARRSVETEQNCPLPALRSSPHLGDKGGHVRH